MHVYQAKVSLIESNDWGIFETERNSAFMEWAVSQFSYQQEKIELRFYVPIDIKYVISEMFFLGNLLAQ